MPLSQKESRLLWPYLTNKLLNGLKLDGIKSEMTYASKNYQIYDLWWHPHNFGDNPDENISDLRNLLAHHKKCEEEYSFGSLNMCELNSLM